MMKNMLLSKIKKIEEVLPEPPVDIESQNVLYDLINEHLGGDIRERIDLSLVDYRDYSVFCRSVLEQLSDTELSQFIV